MTGLPSELITVAGPVAADAAKGLVARLFGPALTEIGETWGDRARLFRLRSWLSVVEKAEKAARERGYKLEPKEIAFGDAFRLIEAASLEDEPEVQDLWAGLIANLASPEASTEVQKVFIDLLRGMSSAEAALLKLLSDAERAVRPRDQNDFIALERRLAAQAEAGWRRYPQELREVSIQNLLRNRCIAHQPARFEVSGLFGNLPVGTGLGGWAVVKPQEFQRLFAQLADVLVSSSGAKAAPERRSLFRNGGMRVEELSYMLTPLGRALMEACGAPIAEGSEGSASA